MSNDTLVALGITVVGGLTVEAVKAISPYLASTLPGQSVAFDVSMQMKGNQRIESLLQRVHKLDAENKQLKPMISETERLSPSSGYTKTLQEYVTTPIEEKVEFLRNALINGLYGSYTVALREDFYRLISELQPADIAILQYLTEQCPNLAYLKHLIGKQRLEDNVLKNIIANTSMYYYSHDKEEGIRQEVGGIELYCVQNGIPEEVEKRSLDRLRAQALIFNPLPTMDFSDPYEGCIPTQFAQDFLKFIADPDIQGFENVQQ